MSMWGLMVGGIYNKYRREQRRTRGDGDDRDGSQWRNPIRCGVEGSKQTQTKQSKQTNKQTNTLEDWGKVKKTRSHGTLIHISAQVSLWAPTFFIRILLLHTHTHTHTELYRKGLGFMFPVMCFPGCWPMSWCKRLSFLQAPRWVCGAFAGTSEISYFQLLLSWFLLCSLLSLKKKTPHIRSTPLEMMKSFLYTVT